MVSAKTALVLMTGLFLGSTAAEAANALILPARGSGKLPPPGHSIPMRLPKTTASAFPVENRANDLVPIAGKASASAARPGRASLRSGSDVTSMAYSMGTERWPYSAARVASNSDSLSTSAIDNPVTASPYRQTGLLLVEFDGATYQCSASLVMPNVLVTAAHCVQDFGLGAAGEGTNIHWFPANTGAPVDGDGNLFDASHYPFGVWTAQKVVVADSYYNGTDTCARDARGIVCNNDIALIALNPQDGKTAATVLDADAYMYGWNGYSYIRSPAFKNLTVVDITELGYPVAFDNGEQMQRNNSFGKYVTTRGTRTTTRKPLLNTLLGTPLSGGSSGGPWLANFGTRPVVDGSEANLGNASAYYNIVVGVTSYGYTTPGLHVQGSSFFGQNHEFPLAEYGDYGAGNIGALMQRMCTAVPEACD